VTRTTVRRATLEDLDLLVRHRRAMFEAIHDFSTRELDAADPVYRRWARSRIRSGNLAGFIVESAGRPLASGCVWLTEVQPRPGRDESVVAYLLSMFTEPDERGKGHATRIVKAAMAWARKRGVTTMTLHASKYGESIYRDLGFERTAEMRRSLSRGTPRIRGPRTPGRRATRRSRESRRSPEDG
jgi:GNAT superfamily N-acetyltransferase